MRRLTPDRTKLSDLDRSPAVDIWHEEQLFDPAQETRPAVRTGWVDPTGCQRGGPIWVTGGRSRMLSVNPMRPEAAVDAVDHHVDHLQCCPMGLGRVIDVSVPAFPTIFNTIQKLYIIHIATKPVQVSPLSRTAGNCDRQSRGHQRGAVCGQNGYKWRALPARFGNWHTIYTRLRRWAAAGVLERVFQALQEHRLIRIRVECVG